MSQHSMTVENARGLIVRESINKALQALASMNSGDVAPEMTFAFQPWVDTSLTNPTLKLRNATNNAWVEIGPVNKVAFDLDVCASGNTEPLHVKPFKFWVDTSTPATPLLKIRNAADTAWVTLGRADLPNLGLLPLVGGNISGILNLLATSHFKLPTGTTAERLEDAPLGAARFNSTFGKLEFFNGTTWEQTLSGLSATLVTHSFKANGLVKVKNSIDGIFVLPFPAKITNVILAQEVGGDSADTQVDIKVKPQSTGAFESIFTTKPSINHSAGANTWVGLGDTILNCTAPVLADQERVFDASSGFRMDLLSRQPGSRDVSVTLIFQKI